MISGKLTSLTEILRSLQAVAYYAVISTYIARRHALMRLYCRSPAVGLGRLGCPRSGQKGRKPAPLPARRRTKPLLSLLPSSFYPTRSSHAGYASAISMQPAVRPVWRQAHERGALLA